MIYLPLLLSFAVSSAVHSTEVRVRRGVDINIRVDLASTAYVTVLAQYGHDPRYLRNAVIEGVDRKGLGVVSLLLSRTHGCGAYMFVVGDGQGGTIRYSWSRLNGKRVEHNKAGPPMLRRGQSVL